jgi:hypothetical protein
VLYFFICSSEKLIFPTTKNNGTLPSTKNIMQGLTTTTQRKNKDERPCCRRGCYFYKSMV